MKVYIIRYEEMENGGISYVFDTMKKAQLMMKIIKKDMMKKYKNIEECKNGFVADHLTDYIKYKIEEMEVK